MIVEWKNAIIWDGSEQQLKDLLGDKFESWNGENKTLTLTNGTDHYLDLDTNGNMISVVYWDAERIDYAWITKGVLKEVIPEELQYYQYNADTPRVLPEPCIELTQDDTLTDRLLTLVEDMVKGLIQK